MIPAAWLGQVLVSDAERHAFEAIVALGFRDTFRMFEQPDKLYSWWDYRMLAFRRNMGLRIDHILVSPALVPRVVSCVIDRAARKTRTAVRSRARHHDPVLNRSAFNQRRIVIESQLLDLACDGVAPDTEALCCLDAATAGMT